MGNCSSIKHLLTADFPAPLAPTTATRLTCNTVRFTSTIKEYTKIHARHAQDDLAVAPHFLKETRIREGEFLSSRFPARSAPSIWVLFHALNKHEHIAVHQLSRAQVHLHLSHRRSSSSRATLSSPRGPGQSDLPGQTRAVLGRPEPRLNLLMHSTLNISNMTCVMYFPTINMFTRASVRKTVRSSLLIDRELNRREHMIWSSSLPARRHKMYCINVTNMSFTRWPRAR